MTIREVEALKTDIERYLDSTGRNLIENALYCLQTGSDYRAECSIRTLKSNLLSEGNYDVARRIELIL